MKRAHIVENQRGFSLIGVIVAVGLLGLLSAMLSGIFQNSMKAQMHLEQRDQLLALKRMMKEADVLCPVMKEQCDGMAASGEIKLTLRGEPPNGSSVLKDPSGTPNPMGKLKFFRGWRVGAYCEVNGDARDMSFTFARYETSPDGKEKLARDPVSGKEVNYRGSTADAAMLCGSDLEGGDVKFEQNFQKANLVKAWDPVDDEQALLKQHLDPNHRALTGCIMKGNNKVYACDQTVRWEPNELNPYTFPKSTPNAGKYQNHPIANRETCLWIKITDKNGNVRTFPKNKANRQAGIAGKKMEGWARGYSPSNLCTGGVYYDPNQVAASDPTATASTIQNDVFGAQIQVVNSSNSSKKADYRIQITGLTPGKAAAAAGLKVGDQILKIEDINLKGNLKQFSQVEEANSRLSKLLFDTMAQIKEGGSPSVNLLIQKPGSRAKKVDIVFD